MTDDNTQIRDAIKNAIDENKVILFMKGTPEQPACGFSARTVATLQALGTPFAAVDILPHPAIRQELSTLSKWPTIPQLFVDGELVGVEQPADAPVEAAAAPPRQSAPMQIQDRP